MYNINIRTRRITALGIMLAVIIVLSVAEGYLVPPNPANLRLGLSNIVIMYCLFYLNKKEAVLLLVLKSIFIFLTRGAMGSALSLTGGLLSVGIMIVLEYIGKEKISYLILSISGAIGHNVGQIIMASILLKNLSLFYYLPVMLIFGVISGVITGVLLKCTMPYLGKMNGRQFK